MISQMPQMPSFSSESHSGPGHAPQLPQYDHLTPTRRLLPQVLDTIAVEDPDHVLGMAARSSDISQGFTSITTSALARAVNNTAHWIDTLPYITPKSTEPVAYIGNLDFRYWAMELAAMKTGHPLLMPSSKNALQNTVMFLESSKCRILIYSHMMEDQVVKLSKLVAGLQIVEISSLESLSTGPAKHYPYDKSWEEAKADVVMIVHTSGSTGTPKPIFYTNEWLGASLDCEELVPSVPGRTLANVSLFESKKLFYTGNAFWHISGVSETFHTICHRATAVMGPSDAPRTGKLLRDVMKAVKLHGIIAPPSILDDMCSEDADSLVPYIAELDHVCWLGGPLSTATGNWITKHTSAHLWQLFGSTELGPYQLVVPPRSHWQYMEFHPKIGPTMERLSPDSDLYELVTYRQHDPSLEWSQPGFMMFTDLEVWRSKDAVSRCTDPGFENLWKYEGRLDDMMVLSNGQKVNPLHIELRLLSNSAIKGCLVIGNGQKKCGLLIEPKDPAVDAQKLKEALWPEIEQVNSLIPEHAQVQREFLVVAVPEKPFSRASKGTVIRSLVTKAYAGEIEEVYAKAA